MSVHLYELCDEHVLLEDVLTWLCDRLYPLFRHRLRVTTDGDSQVRRALSLVPLASPADD